jgi:uncharacterized hydrophobic protein (TIGR00271 family)
MTNSFLDKFRLLHDKEEAVVIVDNIDRGVEFRGTSLWVLIFAIFIASLGLNVNSTAVIIGAMLISPLMGPIMGLGLAVGINDLSLLRRSIFNYLLATVTALATSTVFFLISPLNSAHSEILARTSPNIYDVLIALFGGLAGILATGSKQKGNVIPGVAIATALMPPLCTAGYGLATLQIYYFIGAFYLFIINTVFIALATFITVRLLHLPYKRLPDKNADVRAKRVIWAIVILTLVPSIYFGYDIVMQDKFMKKANLFIETEAKFPNDYLLSKNIDAKNYRITLTFGGQQIPESQIAGLKSKLKAFGLERTRLEVQQGFAYLSATNTAEDGQVKQLSLILKSKEAALQAIQLKMDSLNDLRKTAFQVFRELKVQYPDITSAIINPSERISGDDSTQPVLLVILDFSGNKNSAERKKMEDWMKVRLSEKNIEILFRKTSKP